MSYNYDSEGKFIPASQRPDGTWRKARRVRQGYVPQEEVPLYESKGKQFQNKQNSDVPVGMCPFAAASSKEKRDKLKKEQHKTATLAQSAENSSSQKLCNKNNKTKKIQQDDQPQQQQSKTILKNPAIHAINNVQILNEQVENMNLIDNNDIAKKLRKLKKKMREIERIEEKLKSGELKKNSIDKDQLDKVKRKNEILKEIEELEDSYDDSQDAKTETIDLTTVL